MRNKILISILVIFIVGSGGVVAQETSKNVIKNFGAEVTDINNSDDKQSIMISYNNLRNTDDPLLVSISLPENAEYINYSTQQDHTKKQNQKKWLFRPSEEESVSMRVSVKLSDFSQTQKARVTGQIGLNETRNLTVKLPEKQKVLNIIDSNNNYHIDDEELLKAINYWKEDTEIGQGQKVSSEQLLKIIEFWKNDTRFIPVVPASNE